MCVVLIGNFIHLLGGDFWTRKVARDSLGESLGLPQKPLQNLLEPLPRKPWGTREGASPPWFPRSFWRGSRSSWRGFWGSPGGAPRGPLLHSGVPELRGLTAFFRLSESSKCARHRDFDRGSIRVCYSIAPRIPPGRAFFVRNRGS